MTITCNASFVSWNQLSSAEVLHLGEDGSLATRGQLFINLGVSMKFNLISSFLQGFQPHCSPSSEPLNSLPRICPLEGYLGGSRHLSQLVFKQIPGVTVQWKPKLWGRPKNVGPLLQIPLLITHCRNGLKYTYFSSAFSARRSQSFPFSNLSPLFPNSAVYMKGVYTASKEVPER